MNKIVGLDLGTNSIGISIRNLDNGNDVLKQIESFSAIVFQSGVGKGQTGEFSYAAERAKNRSVRRMYQSRKYRIWSTLELLIKNDMCPLSMDDFVRWSKYDKSKGLKREYPNWNERFEKWVRLDFDGDGVADYSSPYQLRAELMEKQYDFTNQIERYKLGRALYHIAQRRGFKSSKGETIADQEKNIDVDFNVKDEDMSVALKQSEEKASGKLVEYMKRYDLPTVGCAFYNLEKSGIRVRNSEYQAIRSQYKDEIRKIFDFQDGLDIYGDLYEHLISEKKGVGTIFFKKPLRSQKGLVGRCTLEPTKYRCPISHPEYEKFRAWCFINNIRFGDDLNESLSLEQKEKLYNERFLLTRSSFRFEDIRKWLEVATGNHYDYNKGTINYKDKTNVAGCPISGRLKNLLGDDWESWQLVSKEEKLHAKTSEIQHIKYDALDLWHVCFSFEEPELVQEFAKNKLKFDGEQAGQLVRIYGAIQQGYGMLSLKAIKNINRFLQKGLIYSDAVLLAKLPDLFKDKWTFVESGIINGLDNLIIENKKQKHIFGIANTLIANYKSLGYNEETKQDERFAERNYDYKLQASDYKDVEKVTIEAVGKNTWMTKSDAEKRDIIQKVADLYKSFFASSKRDYYKLPKVSESLAVYLKDKYQYLSDKDLSKIYHPSMIEYYSPSKIVKTEDGRYLKLLGSPVIGALKNPMAMRVLHTLRKQINALLTAKDDYGNALLDEDTRIVVETARELNDANMRWAIETYQREREAENKEFERLIQEFHPERSVNNGDIDMVRLLCDQNDILDNTTNVKDHETTKKEKQEFDYKKAKEKDIIKYRLWLEQGCRCVYTGKIINISNLFDDNAFDIEHTIPRSMSFDNSLANLTICDAHFNRTVKRNQIPAQLSNYDEILQRIQPWKEKVEQLKDNVEFWKTQSKRAQDRSRKDYCVRQRHLWEMELDYWKNKVDRFTMTEVTSGFRNSQLVDTRIITKYAYHYLKTVFNKVEVQKGSVTADFRKMLGIQSMYEKKSRDKHSHHAVDATILTLIPTAAKRDQMLELYYTIQEKQKMNEDVSTMQRRLLLERRNCGLAGDVSEIVPFIENNIMINHISKDQTLTPAHRRKRIRGRIVPKRDEYGNILYELNEDETYKLDGFGNRIPEAKEWISGDSIRGQLHKDHFFGAIKCPANSDAILMVIHVPINSFKNEDELEKIIDANVRASIEKTISKRKAENKQLSFKAAIEEPIWLLDNNGNEIKTDKNGRLLSPIRHVRCKVSAGRGFFTKDKAIEVKKQTYLSKHEYKNKYYAQNDGNYLCLLYEGIKKGKVERRFRFLNYFDIVTLGIKNIDDLKNEHYFQVIEEKNVKLNLTAIIKAGTRVLMWLNDPEELIGIDEKELNKRLFVVYKFNFKGANCIYLQNHIEARNEIPRNEEFTIFDNNKYQARLTLVANGFNCLIEQRDFIVLDTGKLQWL